MCSTACWTWDAQLMSASPELAGAGVSAPTPLIRATQPPPTTCARRLPQTAPPPEECGRAGHFASRVIPDWLIPAQAILAGASPDRTPTTQPIRATQPLAHGPASGHGDERRRRGPEPHAGAGTPDLHPHHLTLNGGGGSATAPLIRATLSRQITNPSPLGVSSFVTQ